MSQLPDPAPSAVTVARRLLAKDAAKALIQARALLAKDPKALEVQFLLGAAQRRTGDLVGACERLTALANAHPQAWGLRFEAGAALALLGRPALAVPYLAQACRLNPGSSLARHALGDQLVLLGQTAAAAEAYDHPLPGSISDLGLHKTALELFDKTDPAAKARLGDHFNLHLNDPLAVCLLADVGLRLDRAKGVEILVAEQLNRGATFAPLRQRLAMALFRQQRWADALAEIERALASAPDSKLARELQAAILVQLGGYEKALSAYEGLIRETPKRPDLWLSYGHVLKTMGRQTQSVEAYRRCLNLEPASGDAYWGLANLKVVPFTNADVAQMRTALQSATLSQPARTSLHYAMGKALEDRKAYQEAFDHYSCGAALANAAAPFDVSAHRALIVRQIEIFTAAFFEARKGSGASDKGPIFIVGLPRSGSTLVEQILAGHSEVEGLSELADLTVSARSLQSGSSGASYPRLLGELAPHALEALGQRYISGAHAYRKSDRPFFVDKFPGNFLQIGLIQLTLPNARIIDARRRPMACCLSLFKQYFAEGQNYSYSLEALGFYYSSYLTLMDHFDKILPERLHHVSYEALVLDPELEVRRLLDYCGLTFEQTCLSPQMIDRPVRTASSEQVRRPISSENLEHWRCFEPWLAPLKAALAQGF